MSTQPIPSRFHKHTISIIFSLLASLLLSLQLVLPSTTFAASPHASSSYTFGTSQPLDLASVAVVRLAVTTSPALGQLPKPCKSGLGVIVSSNPSATQHGNFLNYVLTDSSLLSCSGATPGSFAVTLYANDAYTNNATSAVTLATSTCAVDLSTCATTSTPQTSGKSPATICPTTACSTESTGAILLPFLTAVPQPFVSPTTTPTKPTFHLKLGDVPTAVLPSAANTLANLLPVASNQQGTDNTTTPVPTSTTQFFEAGTPIVDTNGALVSIHTSTSTGTSDTSFPAAKIPPSLANSLQAKWQTDVADFYSKNYTAVSNNASSIEAINTNFLAATGLKAVATTFLTPTPTTQPNGNNNNVPGTNISNGAFGIPGWVLAIIGLILLVLLLLLVILFVGRRRRRELARFEQE